MWGSHHGNVVAGRHAQLLVCKIVQVMRGDAVEAQQKGQKQDAASYSHLQACCLPSFASKKPIHSSESWYKVLLYLSTSGEDWALSLYSNDYTVCVEGHKPTCVQNFHAHRFAN